MNPDELTRQWADVRHAAAFSGGDIFHKAHPEVSAKKIKLEILPTIPTYQKYRAAKPPRITNPYFVRTIRKVFQSDLIFMRNPREMVMQNRGFQYILIVQDIFSRKIWATPLKSKRADIVVSALEAIFRSLLPLHKDARLVIDRGTEFLNNAVLRLFRSLGLKITHPSDGHGAHVERANLSLQNILYTHMEDKGRGNKRWIAFLPNAVSMMNNRYHRIIKMSPNEAEMPENKYNVNSAMNLYRQKAFVKEQTKSLRKKLPKYSVGDHVRILRYTDKFTRGYNRTFTTEVFQVTKVLAHLPITMYEISDMRDEVVEGHFYPEEMSLVTGDVFKVERVIRRRVVRGERQVYVKWEGYPETMNSWINEADYNIE